ncbi:MAG: OB-fold nucleic acid binding domain-containing protein, partial [Actinomycetota bacterium]|nr:OB-fold nucleic acid binding domain-containing protein [Actinomycetota bacterium]
DLATARAIQYARTLTPDEIRAVHIEIDTKEARTLEQEWSRLGVSHLDLEVVECADRRIRRAALDVVAEAALPGDSEVTVLLPRRVYPGFMQRILHDRTADALAKVLSQIPHVNATIIPFEVVIGGTDKVIFDYRPKPSGEKEQSISAHETEAFGARLLEGTMAIGDVVYRRRAKVAGRVRSVRVQPMDSVPSLAVRLEDGTGAILLVFAGKRQVPGIEPGRRMTAEGTVGEIEGHIAIMNPTYEFAPVEVED